MSAEDYCRSCRFFQMTHDSDINAIGQCRRFSPVPVYVASALLPRAQWPQVNADKDWCGQYKPVKSNPK